VTRTHSRLVAVLALLVLCGCPDTRPKRGTPKPPTGEWIRPFDGFLPEDPPVGVSVLHVIDAITRAPIEGAVVRQHYEIDVGPDGWAPIAAEGRTDEYGLATIRVPREQWHQDRSLPDAHWAVHAEGYASTQEYGGALETVIELHPARTRHGRIVDAMGRPLAHARIGYKEGCGHSPFLVETKTDSNGVFVLSGTDASGDVYYAGRGVHASYFSPELRTLDQTPPTDVADACMRITGRIVGADIDTLRPRMIHATADVRGVFARIQDDGRFVLDGASPDGLMTLWCTPTGQIVELRTDLWRLGGPCIYDVRLGKSDPTESDTVAHRLLRVNVVDDQDAPMAWAHAMAFRTVDGREADFDLRSPDEPKPWLALSLLPGTYDIELDPQGQAYAAPVRVTVGMDDPEPLTIRAQAHPRLEVEYRGFDKDDVGCSLAYANAAGYIDHEGPLDVTDHPWVPADAEARVAADWGDVVTFHEVGPVQDGVRRVVIEAPRAQRLRFTSALDPESVYFGGDEVRVTRGPAENQYEFATRRRGTLALVIEPEDGPRSEPRPYTRTLVTLGEPDDAVRDLGVLSVPAWDRPRGRLTLLDGQGRPRKDVEVRVTCDQPSATDEPTLDFLDYTDAQGALESFTLRDGCRVTYRLGEVDVTRQLLGEGPWTLQTGNATIELEAHGPWGLLMSSSLMLDGELQSVLVEDVLDEPDDDRDVPPRHEAARYRLEGLEPGPHVLIVTAPGHRGEARRIILKAGETRRIRVDLPARK